MYERGDIYDRERQAQDAGAGACTQVWGSLLFEHYADSAALAECRKRFDVDGSILEVGCGTGMMLRRLEDEDRWSVRGIELSPRCAQVARAACASAVDVGNAIDLPYQSGSFDGVLFKSSLHHMPDRPAALREAWRVLKPGGCVVVFEHNRLFREHMRSPIERAACLFFSIKNARRVRAWPTRFDEGCYYTEAHVFDTPPQVEAHVSGAGFIGVERSEHCHLLAHFQGSLFCGSVFDAGVFRALQWMDSGSDPAEFIVVTGRK